jgi:hypothetical protein
VEGHDKGGWVNWTHMMILSGLSAAVFFADEDCFEQTDENISYGFRGAHLVFMVI